MLSKVTDSLRVTTALDSPFWRTSITDENIQANKKLKERVTKTENIRRIIFVNGDLKKYVRNTVSKALAVADAGDDYHLNALMMSLNRLEELASIFYTRIMEEEWVPIIRIHDRLRLGEEEYAVIKDIVHVYKVSARDRVPQVVIYYPNAERFTLLQDDFTKFFDDAWELNKYHTIPYYVSLVKNDLDEMRKPQYNARFLELYQSIEKHNGPPLNEEADAVLKFLRRFLSRSGKQHFSKYLDVGVCTGRYPSLLINQGMVDSYNISAVDNAEDVKAKIQQDHPDWHFVFGDISQPTTPKSLLAPYNLITSMLGTACHFGLQPQGSQESRFDRGMSHMLNMLAPEGLLLVSVWSEETYEKPPLVLSPFLYGKQTLAYLHQNTPREEQFQKVVESCNKDGKRFRLEEPLNAGLLNIYVVHRIDEH